MIDPVEMSGHPPIQILYEDGALLAVAKPAGMVTHPAYRHPDGALTDAVFARAAACGEGQPWLLHRLDRETSGVVLFAKTEVARRALVRQFERHTVRKQYLALVEGTLIPAEGEIDAPLKRDPLDRRRVIVAADGQLSLTRYRVLGASTGPVAPFAPSAPLQPTAASVSLIMAEPVTGRTHQIRAHLAAHGAVILGDATYRALAAESWTRDMAMGVTRDVATGIAPDDAQGGVADVAPTASDSGILSAPRVMLHAWRGACRYPQAPATDAPFVVTAPLPNDLLTLIRQLGLTDALATLDAVEL